MSNFAARGRSDEDGKEMSLSARREQNNLVAVRKSRGAKGPGSAWCPAERRRMLNMGKPDHDVLAWHATFVGRTIRPERELSALPPRPVRARAR